MRFPKCIYSSPAGARLGVLLKPSTLPVSCPPPLSVFLNASDGPRDTSLLLFSIGDKNLAVVFFSPSRASYPRLSG